MLVVRADVGDEVHMHGYETTKAPTPGKRARIPLTATLAGRFEVELHHPDGFGGLWLRERRRRLDRSRHIAEMRD